VCIAVGLVVLLHKVVTTPRGQFDATAVAFCCLTWLKIADLG
jgi:hypothetical protein